MTRDEARARWAASGLTYEALYRAACARWEQDNNGAGRDDILRPDGEIDEARCIQMLADPGASWDGTEIEDSICESY